MDNAGIVTLAALQISAAMSLKLLTPIVGLDGMTACNLEANFQYGSGGTNCSAMVATSFDGGTSWRHIARFDFLVATRVAIANLSGLLSKAVSSYADLSVEGVNDGLLGDRLAVYLVSTGTYVNTTLSVRASVR
jgi:hypothetical protein